MKKLKEKKGKTKQIDQDTLNAAKAKAAEIDKQQAMAQIPKTAAGFEKDFNAIKKDKAALQQYLQNIPCAQIESYFKRTEVNYELLCGILSAVEPIGDKEWVGKMLLSLSKADNFEMTLMFVEEEEKNLLESIAKKAPTALQKELKRKYQI